MPSVPYEEKLVVSPVFFLSQRRVASSDRIANDTLSVLGTEHSESNFAFLKEPAYQNSFFRCVSIQILMVNEL